MGTSKKHTGEPCKVEVSRTACLQYFARRCGTIRRFWTEVLVNCGSLCLARKSQAVTRKMVLIRKAIRTLGTLNSGI